MVKFGKREANATCLVYCPLPYSGEGPAQTCVSILQNLPDSEFQKQLVLPRATRSVDQSIELMQAVSFPLRYLPWRIIANLGARSLDRHFLRLTETASTRNSVACFMPSPPLSLLKHVRACGHLTVREMINTFRGTAKKILDQAYKQHGLRPSHAITDESVEQEREELAEYDFIFASNSLAETSLLEAGVESTRIVSSSFGWSPSRFSFSPKKRNKRAGFVTLFVGALCVRKGVLELLAAWQRSRVGGKLVLAGKVEEAIKPLLKPYLTNNSIRILDYVSDVGSLYYSADIFVFPTLEEGGPQVTYEAAGCGLPVITTPMGAGRIIRHNVNGFIVEPNDIEGLAKAIVQLADSKELCNRFSRQAVFDAQQFTYEKIGLARSAQLKILLGQRGILKTVGDSA